MMDDWPRLDEAEHPAGDGVAVWLYRRDDEAGRGFAFSLYCGNHEVARYDLFPGACHEHWNVDNAPRRPYPYAWPWRRQVDLACSNLVEHARIVLDATGHGDVTLNVDALHAAMREVKAQLLQPPTQVVIPCAGQGDRWHDYLGRRKHMVSVDGETLLARLVRQLRGHGLDAITVLAPPDAEEYALPGVETAWHAPDPEWLDADKFMSSRPWWHGDGRTIVLFGDVWFSDATIARVARATDGEWSVVGRPGPHPLVGKPWPEAFGAVFWHHHAPQVEASAARLLDLYRRQVTDGCSLWHLYRAMLGFPDEMMSRNLAGEHLLLVNDWTHDFDLPDDYERFMEAR